MRARLTEYSRKRPLPQSSVGKKAGMEGGGAYFWELTVQLYFLTGTSQKFGVGTSQNVSLL